MRGHEKDVMHAEFSPSGNRVLSASMDGPARLWDLQGHERVVFRGHEGMLASAAFSPDDQRVATASLDKTARILDLMGNELAVIQSDYFVMKVVFSPDGARILTASTEAREWYVHGEDLLEFANKRVSRELTPSERLRYGDLLGD